MNVIIRQAKIHSGNSPHHGKQLDILISEGRIHEISPNIATKADQEISGSDLHVSAGWFDCFATVPDPGHEYRETLQSAASAAAAGGFTEVMVSPEAKPHRTTKTSIEYIINQSTTLPVRFYPIGGITKNLEGKELAEMYDMGKSGAMAFTDGSNPVQTPGVLLKALQYVLTNDQVIIQQPNDQSISRGGLMNEGIYSTRLGLPGAPAIAEELMIMRDLELLAYTNSKLHITGISTAKSLELIKAAKAKGLQVTCSVTPYSLLFTDADLQGYDTNFKLVPPLRGESDRDALRAGLINGDIDCIASHHTPLHQDEKDCEFEYAKPGVTGFETLFPALLEAGIPLDTIIESITTKPRHIFNVPIPEIKEGAAAQLTVFSPTGTFTYNKQTAKSCSHNSAFLDKELTGKVIATISNHHTHLNS